MADDIPTAKVQQLKGQGYTNSQVIDVLQHDGYSSSQIFDALNQASTPDGGMPDAPPAPGAPPSEPAPPPMAAEPMAPQMSPQSPPMAPPSHGSVDVSTEEYVEAIIDEKWAELEGDIQKVVDWKNRSEQRLTTLSQVVADL